MTLRSLELSIVGAAKVQLRNPKIRLIDLLEWRCSPIEPQAGEVVIKVYGTYAAFPSKLDKREKVEK